jgi:hypothetical protein
VVIVFSEACKKNGLQGKSASPADWGQLKSLKRQDHDLEKAVLSARFTAAVGTPVGFE